ncbi:DnaB helicase-like protein [Williamsia limnetica]|uniref:DnaB helicase-like protein n=1 Tax=Williamsia limnetica TaxID=882452 RepID=A0A318RG23_WILLI|nr:DnaB-like helicase N-terminal domain-containing protein [Williamsia limnetica]PYE13466.1 DnaB helicase-like protein [Williamsia limnetica]
MTITATDMSADTVSAGELPDDERAVTVGQFPGGLGADLDTESTITLAVEAAFLTALMWAPADMARQIRQILVTSDRWDPFWSAPHREIFDAVCAVLDSGAPPNPTLVQAHLFETGHLRRVEQHLLAIISPTQGPMVGGADLPHLAAKVVDQWYRRGYAGLLTRMAQVRESVSVEELSGHWANLTGHQLRAEELWLTKRDELAKL